MGNKTRLTATPALSLLVVSHSCLEPVSRSVYRYLHREYGVPVHLAVPRYNDLGEGFELCGPVDNEPVHVSVLEPVGSHLRLRRLRGLKSLIRLTNPSHILLESDPATWMVSEVLGVRGKARVWSLTAANSAGDKKFPADWPACWIEKYFLYRAKRLSRVFTINRLGTEAFQRLGFPVTQVPWGFDPSLFFPQDEAKVRETRARLGLTEKTVGYFGRLVPEKGLDLLLEALACQKGLRWQLLLDEFKPNEYTLSIKHRIREYGLSDRVVWFGATHSTVADYMNACHFAVLPSRTWRGRPEQYGRVVPEAMACGKVVLGSDSGAIPDLIGNPNYIFPQGNLGSLSQLLQRTLLLTEEELCELGRQCRERAVENFSIKTQAAQFWELLQKDEREWKSNRERDALGFLQVERDS